MDTPVLAVSHIANWMGSYISLIDESDFLQDPDKYIENAYHKSDKYDEFDLIKQR